MWHVLPTREMEAESEVLCGVASQGHFGVGRLLSLKAISQVLLGTREG